MVMIALIAGSKTTTRQKDNIGFPFSFPATQVVPKTSISGFQRKMFARKKEWEVASTSHKVSHKCQAHSPGGTKTVIKVQNRFSADSKTGWHGKENSKYWISLSLSFVFGLRTEVTKTKKLLSRIFLVFMHVMVSLLPTRVSCPNQRVWKEKVPSRQVLCLTLSSRDLKISWE